MDIARIAEGNRHFILGDVLAAVTVPTATDVTAIVVAALGVTAIVIAVLGVTAIYCCCRACRRCCSQSCC